MCLGGGGWDRVGRGETEEWWPGTGLNRRRRPFQGRALPLSYLASVQMGELQFPARIPAMPVEVGESTDSALQQLSDSISSSDWLAKPGNGLIDGPAWVQRGFSGGLENARRIGWRGTMVAVATATCPIHATFFCRMGRSHKSWLHQF